jgi:hypothetical protein
MPDVATLGIKIENRDVDKATTSLDGLTVAGTKTEAAAARLTRRMALAEIAAREMDAEMGKNGRTMALLQIEAQKMDAEYGQMSRQMGLLEIEARKMDAAMTASTKAIEHGTEAHEPHIHGLSRIGTALATMVGHATGVPPVLERIGDALAITAFGHLATVGVLAGFAAIAFAYEKITEKAREAAKEIEKTRGAIAEAANAGKTDPIQEAARRLQFGEPFDKEHKLVPVSEFAPGAFEGSLADLQAKLRALQTQFYATTNGFTQIQIQKQIVGVKESLKPMERFMADIQAAAANVATQPGENAGKLNPVRVEALSADATEKAFEKWASLQDRQIKGLSLAGELSGTRIAQLELEAKQWTAVAGALGVANPRYERYMQLAREANDLVQKQDTMADTASRAHDAFAKAFKVPAVVSPGDTARMGIVAGLIPNPKDLADQLSYTITVAVDAVKDFFRQQANQERYVNDMRKEWRRGLDDMLSGGLRSWSSFFDSVFGLFRRLMDRMEAAGKDSGLGYTALKYGSVAIGAGMAGYQTGQSLYSTSHSTSGNYARGALSGAAQGAAMGAMIAGPAGAAVGALAGFVGGIMGVGSAAKEAARQMAEAVKAVSISMDALRANVRGDTLAEGIAGIEADREQRRKMIEDAWSGGDANSDRVQWRTKKLKEMNALEDERIAKLREEYAQQQTYAREDLEVRKLRAEGHTKEADAMARQQAADREIAQAIADHRSDEYIATLKYVTGLELATNAMDKATSSAVNMVEGYKLQAEVFRVMASGPRTSSLSAGGYGSSYTQRVIPTGGTRGMPQPTTPQVLQPVVFTVDGRVLAEGMLKQFGAGVTGGNLKVAFGDLVQRAIPE